MTAMTLSELLAALKSLQAEISVQDAKLKLKIPRGAMDEALKNALQHHKAELICVLTGIEDQAEEDAVIIDPENQHQPFDLSDLQRGFLTASDPHMEFHVQPHYYLEYTYSHLDLDRLKIAANSVLSRHAGEMVRIVDGPRLARLTELLEFPITVADCRELSFAEAEEQLLLHRKAGARKDITLQHWPWIEIHATRWIDSDKNEKVRLHVNNNNFYSDGVGFTVFWKELWDHYHDQSLSLAPVSLSLRDAHKTLESFASTKRGENSKRYWAERIDALPDPPPLPVDSTRNRRIRSQLSRREHILPEQVWSAIKEGAGKVDISPSTALYTAYFEVICAWSNCDHFTISNMMTRRLPFHPDIYSLIGNFASLYPLEVDFRDAESFVDRALTLQKRILKDSEHLHIGGIDVIREYGARSGVFGAAPIPFVVGSGLHMVGFERAEYSCLETCQVLLDHQFWEQRNKTLYIVWDVLEEFFHPEVIDAMQSAYINRLCQLAENTALWSEKHQPVFVRRKNEKHDLIPLPGIRQRLEKTLDVASASSASVMTSTETLSHGELGHVSRIVATRLTQLGVVAGDRIVVCCDKTPNTMALILGILQVNAVYVPVNTDVPQQRLDRIAMLSNATLVVCRKNNIKRTLNESSPLITLDQLINTAIGTSSPGNSITSTELRQPTGSDTAYIIFTSGTTGDPKGVEMNHTGPMNTVLDINKRFNITPADVFFGVSSLGFDLSIYDIFGSLAAGASLIWPEPSDSFKPNHWLDCITEQQVTIWNSAPALGELLCDAAENRGQQLGQLRVVLLSGDWVPKELAERLKRVAPNATIVSLGGATEASIWSIFHVLDEAHDHWVSVPYGKALSNQYWRIIDKYGRDAPDWVVGELHIGGDGLALAYHGDPAQTKVQFMENAYNTDQRLYRTGDLGRFRENGNIEFHGRLDGQVKLSGYRVETGEIENSIRSVPGVSECVVYPVRDEFKTVKFLSAFYVCEPDVETTPANIREHTSKDLPGYMVPDQFNELAVLPLTSNGKRDLKALALMVHNEAEEEQHKHEYIAPTTDTEKLIAALWSEVLNIDESTIGQHSDFFAMGGRSFQAIQTLSRLSLSDSDDIGLQDLVEHPTLAAFSSRISCSGDAGHIRSSLVLLDANGNGIPVIFVHPAGGDVGCYRELAESIDAPVYGLQFIYGANHNQSIFTMAEAYAGFLEDHFVSGQILLSGWSSGAPIAFAVAQFLSDSEQLEVHDIVIVDSPAPGAFDTTCDEHHYRDWYIDDLNLDHSLTGDQVFNQVRERRLAECDWIDATVVFLKACGHPLGQDRRLMSRSFDTFKTVVSLTRDYRSTTTADLAAHVYRAREQVVDEYRNHPDEQMDDWGWAALCSKVPTSKVITGNHYDMTRGSSAVVLAQDINSLISLKGNNSTLHTCRDVQKASLQQT